MHQYTENLKTSIKGEVIFIIGFMIFSFFFFFLNFLIYQSQGERDSIANYIILGLIAVLVISIFFLLEQLFFKLFATKNIYSIRSTQKRDLLWKLFEKKLKQEFFSEFIMALATQKKYIVFKDYYEVAAYVTQHSLLDLDINKKKIPFDTDKELLALKKDKFIISYSCKLFLDENNTKDYYVFFQMKVPFFLNNFTYIFLTKLGG